MFDKLREKISVAKTSATIGVATGLVAVGTAYETVPEFQALVKALVPDEYEGIALAFIGLVVAVARFRTLGK